MFEDAAAGKSGPLALPVEARFHSASRHATVGEPERPRASCAGSDPALAKEYVVLSAHLDHLGIGRAEDGDAIYNGAFDNASGTAGILEIARAFTSDPAAPATIDPVRGRHRARRRGSWAPSTSPHTPRFRSDGIVADLNMDMFLTLYPVKDVVAFGASTRASARW